MIRYLEELSLNAWPALQTLVHDGWVLRFANGYTKRANSVNPLYPPTHPTADNIHLCEQLFAGRGLDAVFKITPAAQPQDLDDRLADRGYRSDSRTSVQVADLSSADMSPLVRFDEQVTEDWLDQFCHLSRVKPQHRPTMTQMLSSLLLPSCYMTLIQDGQVIACGLGVQQAGYVGLLDIVTDEAFRSRGFGQQLVASILAWGKYNGASKAWLGVMLNNPPALRLYAKLGFREVYQYWYRIASS